jgi:hypothetical protein
MSEKFVTPDDTFIVRQRRDCVIVVFPTGFVLNIPNEHYEAFLDALDEFNATHDVPGAK